MKKDWTLTEEAFDLLLFWLNSDRSRAAQKYEKIRWAIIRIYARRGCPIAEDIADETFNRVARKAPEIAPTYEGDPALYCYKVARNVYNEYLDSLKKKYDPPPPPPPEETEETKIRYECFDKCIKELGPETQALLLDYYHGEKRGKIDHRKEMAERGGISINTLRTRAHRAKIALQKCVEDCLKEKKGKEENRISERL